MGFRRAGRKQDRVLGLICLHSADGLSRGDFRDCSLYNCRELNVFSASHFPASPDIFSFFCSAFFTFFILSPHVYHAKSPGKIFACQLDRRYYGTDPGGKKQGQRKEKEMPLPATVGGIELQSFGKTLSPKHFRTSGILRERELHKMSSYI